MTDKEIQNISEIRSYLDKKEVVNTGAYSIWNAKVTYESSTLQTIVLSNAEVRYQYSFYPAIIIDQLRPPYYSNFQPKFQDFKYANGTLTILGINQ